MKVQSREDEYSLQRCPVLADSKMPPSVQLGSRQVCMLQDLQNG